MLTMTNETPEQPKPDDLEIPIESWDSLPKEIRDSLFLRVFRELHNVQDNDRLLVLVTHGFLELLINALIDAKCKNAKRITSNSRDFSHSVKLLVLHEMGLLTDFRYKSLDWFRKLRNKAAHEPLFQVSLKEIAEQFNNVTGQARQQDVAGTSDTLESHHTAHGFYQLCVMLIVTLWTDHSKVFSPVFFPQSEPESAEKSQET